MACGRRCAVAGPTVQRIGSRSFPIASASSVSRALVDVRHAKKCSDTGIPVTPEFPPAKRRTNTGLPVTPKFPSAKRRTDTGLPGRLRGALSPDGTAKPFHSSQ